MTTAMKRLTQQRNVSSGLKRMTRGARLRKKHPLRIQTRLSQTLKRMGPREHRGEAMDLATDQTAHKMLPVSFELFRSTVFPFMPYLS